MSKMCVLRINCHTQSATIDTLTLPCRIGKNGYIAQIKGREGDGKTPLGTYRMRWGFYRADRLSPPPQHKDKPLTWRPLQKEDGWCDDINSSAYNRFIKRPSKESHEALWREDNAYDLIIVIDHNDSPPLLPLGSAVFIHVAQADDRATLGCIAFEPEYFVALLPYLERNMAVELYA